MYTNKIQEKFILFSTWNYWFLRWNVVCILRMKPVQISTQFIQIYIKFNLSTWKLFENFMWSNFKPKDSVTFASRIDT
jgi:hypothetical protein